MKAVLIVPMKDSYMGVAQYPPVGLGYLATAARGAGHQVAIVDCVKEHMDSDRFTDFIKRTDADVFGFTVWSLALKDVKRCIQIVKAVRPRAVCIVGGAHPSALPGSTMDYFPEADFGFVGEGEKGFPLFLDALEHNGAEFSDIPGLVWRRNRSVVVNEPARVEDLDSLGFPSWDLIGVRDYFYPGSLIGNDTAVLTCTRGCPFHCTFCSAWITAGRTIRRRSIAHLFEEVKHLRERYGIRIFDIPDENFTFDRDYVKAFCERALQEKEGLEFFLPNGIRLDSLDRETLLLMRRAGFRREVAVGIESGSERILKAMKKGLTLPLVREKVALLNQTGFRPIGYFILGFPGETRDDMEKTLRLALELKLWAAALTPFAPMPGTEATTSLFQSGALPSDFDFTQVTTDTVAFAPEGMTKEEVDAFRKRALLRFNLRWRPLLYYLGNPDSLRFAFAKLYHLFIKGGQVQGTKKAAR